MLDYNCEDGGGGGGATPQCPTTCTLPLCASTFDSSKLKQNLDGTGNTPFVRLAFVEYTDPEDLDTNNPNNTYESVVVTTGNNSSYFIGNPNNPSANTSCSAVLTSFQYSWGAIHAGNTCKITILDQQGSSFQDWIKRLLQNPEGAGGPRTGVYKMKVKWGWILTNTGGDDGCPTPVVPFTTTVNGQPTTYYSPAASGTRIICSPDCYFLPRDIVVNMNGGKFVYEIEGTDLLQPAQQNVLQKVFGSEDNRISFKQAVIELSKVATPRFNVDFVQREFSSGTAVNPPPPLKFARFLGCTSTPVTASQSDPAIWCETEGPAGIWWCNGLTPLAAISQWLNSVQAADPADPTKGIGITFNFDPTYTCDERCLITRQGVDDDCDPVDDPTDYNNPTRGRLLLWADAYQSCGQSNDSNIPSRVIATYLVNGGSCSPVISFTPNIKWNFFASMRAGGATSPQSPAQRPMLRVDSGATAQQGAACGVGGQGKNRGQQTLGTNQLENGCGLKTAIASAGVHMRANQLFTSIEAELKVQGDPSPELCTPLLGYGRSVSLVVMNPNFITEDSTVQTSTSTNTSTGSTTTSTTTVPPYGGSSGCPGWSTLSSSNCNSPLTNKNWFIKGCDHQIKAGSYITTYKLALYTPGGEGSQAGTGGTLIHLGLDVSSSTDFLRGGYQGTVACTDKWSDGADGVSATPGIVGTECDPAVVV